MASWSVIHIRKDDILVWSDRMALIILLDIVQATNFLIPSAMLASLVELCLHCRKTLARKHSFAPLNRRF